MEPPGSPRILGIRIPNVQKRSSGRPNEGDCHQARHGDATVMPDQGVAVTALLEQSAPDSGRFFASLREKNCEPRNLGKAGIGTDQQFSK